jgi:2'-hydroxyisoflavone reductase
MSLRLEAQGESGMKILILGGTQFLGRAIAQAAQDVGHEITLFNRGSTNPDLFPAAEKLRGDRDGDLSALQGRRWDAVVDTCGYVPRHVELSARLLADAVTHYTFISSISVYDASVHSAPRIDENSPLAALEDETVEEVTAETYSGLKVLCERAAEKAMPGRVLHVRAGLIVGPYDPTDRFTYWPVNVARGGEILAPPPGTPMQIIDVRDLAEWIIRMIEQRQTGVYNATGPDYTLEFGAMLETCRKVVGDGAAQVVAADEAFLLENEVRPWGDLPLWLSTGIQGMARVDVEKALAAGLSFRALDATIADTLAWWRDQGNDRALKAGLTPERHAELLRKVRG